MDSTNLEFSFAEPGVTHFARVGNGEVVLWDDSGNPLGDSGTGCSYEEFLNERIELHETIIRYFGPNAFQRILDKITTEL